MGGKPRKPVVRVVARVTAEAMQHSIDTLRLDGRLNREALEARMGVLEKLVQPVLKAIAQPVVHFTTDGLHVFGVFLTWAEWRGVIAAIDRAARVSPAGGAMDLKGWSGFYAR